MAHFTQQAIMGTFNDMLTEMPFDKITVSALVRRCGISANTFYYHYQDIYDLLKRWLSLEILQFYTGEPPYDDWRVATKAMLRRCRDKYTEIMHIYSSLPREKLEGSLFTCYTDIAYNYTVKYTQSKAVPEATVIELSEFFRMCIFGMFIKFLYGKMNDDIDQLVDKVALRITDALNAELARWPEC